MSLGELAKKRSILFSARVRFSPEIQPVRDAAIEKILEQDLLIAHKNEGLTLREIERQGAICFADGTPAISLRDMGDALLRLVEKGRVSLASTERERRFKLSEGARADLQQLLDSTEARLKKTVRRLFQNAKIDAARYESPFLECLCVIFSKLGEMYVRTLKGELDKDLLSQLPVVSHAIGRIRTKYPDIDDKLFSSGVITFFSESDPDYDAIKWNLAQSYYVARVLGLDPSGRLLSREVFADAVLFLDTNVVVHALAPTGRHHKSFRSLARACANLNIQLRVCQISLDELRRLVGFERELLLRVTDEVPDATAPKVRDVFFELYLERKAAGSPVQVDDLLAGFINPMPTLRDMYKVELVDDEWFIEAHEQVETKVLAANVNKESVATRLRAKSEPSTLHDAMLLRWVERERETKKQKAWALTLDRSLPSCIPCPPQGGESKPLAVAFSGFLQWISPFVALDDKEDEVVSIFSEAIKYQLLPRETFFDLKDFMVFAEMEWSCKQLPAEDVEGCIRYVRANAPNLDPTNPKHRERLAREISRYFADPGRKYKHELERIEKDAIQLVEESDKKTSELEASLRDRDEEIKVLESRIAEYGLREQRRGLRSSALRRLGIVFLIFAGLEGLAVAMSNRYGEGSNLFQKVLHAWQFVGLGFGLAVAAGYFILGRPRIRALGWPFSKIFKEEVVEPKDAAD